MERYFVADGGGLMRIEAEQPQQPDGYTEITREEWEQKVAERGGRLFPPDG